MKIKSSHKKLAFIAFYIILLIGTSLRIYQFGINRSLWEDEAHLALNFIYSGYSGLIQPLAHFQVAPILFLFTIETFTHLFGFTEFSLRFFPFIISILSFPIFYYILKELTKNMYVSLYGFFLFSINISLIYYSSELRSYTIDLSVYLMAVYLSISKCPFIDKYRIILLTFFGTASIFYSNAAIISLCCSGVYFVYNWYLVQKVNHKELIMLIVWGLFYAFNYFLFINNHPYTKGMQEELSYAFCPRNPLSTDFYMFLETNFIEIFFTKLFLAPQNYISIYLISTFMLGSILFILRHRNIKIFIFAFLPIIIHLVLSSLNLYPFYFRFILYLIPSIIILIVIGTIFITNILKTHSHKFLSPIIFFTSSLVFTLPLFNYYPLWFREVKPCLEYINNNYPTTNLFITTPFTLYKFYNLTGHAKNQNYKAISWSINPSEYYDNVSKEKNNYLLFHATDFAVDGYRSVIEDLRKKHLIVKEFEYKSYTVSEIMPTPIDPNKIEIDFKNFPNSNIFDLNGTPVLPIWTGSIKSQSLKVKKGNYKLSIFSSGTPLDGILPKISISINKKIVGEMMAYQNFTECEFPFEIKEDSTVEIDMELKNDANNTITGEDRNVFIKKIFLITQP